MNPAEKCPCIPLTVLIFTPFCKGNGGKGVTEGMETDLRDASPFQHMLQHIGHIIRSDNAQLSGGHEVLIINVEKHGRDSVGSLFI